MNAWLIAATVLLLGLVPCGWVMVRDPAADGLVALELAGTLTVLVLFLLAAGYRRPPYADVALALTVLSYPAGLVFAHFLERWL